LGRGEAALDILNLSDNFKDGASSEPHLVSLDLLRLGRKISVMSSLQQELGLAISLDNNLLRSSIASGQEVPLDEILSLASGSLTLYLTAVLESRALPHVKDRRLLWAEVASFFDELAGVWDESGPDDPRIKWLTGKLRDLRTLAQEQVSLYSVTSRERKKHAKNREDGVLTYGQRNCEEAADYRDQSSPAHIYSVGHF
jgi:hypothetical protein